MLEHLLSLLAREGVNTPTELGYRLGVSESMIEQMLADLSHMGYLRLFSSHTCHTLPGNDHAAQCADCPLTNSCAVAGPSGRVWALTDKALR